MDTYAAIIPVAGLSARMGAFKPLLELNGFPLIRLTAQSALDGGVRTVCVVTGHRAAEVKEALASQASSRQAVQGLEEPACSPSILPTTLEDALLFTHNSHYDKSDMLQSIRLGLHAVLAYDNAKAWASQAVFILPGDMPGVSPKTFVALQKKWQETRPAVLVPCHEGRRGHPLLVSKECFAAILTEQAEQAALAEQAEQTAPGEQSPQQPSLLHSPFSLLPSQSGLRGALAGFEWQELAVDDPGILLDADTPDAFATLESQVRRTRGVSEAIAEELFAHYKTPSNVQEHTRAVAQVALRMARFLNAKGIGLDAELCRSGGELHDLNRVEPLHSQVAATNLQKLGYETLARVVAAHDRELNIEPALFTEANLVFVADKLVKDTTLVSITERYAGAVRRFPPTTEVGKLIQNDSRRAFALLEQYVKLTGDKALLQGRGFEATPITYDNPQNSPRNNNSRGQVP